MLQTLSSLSTTGKNLLRSAERSSLLMTHTTASSVGGFLSSLPPSNCNAFIACLIYSSSSLHCKEGKLPQAHEQSTVIPELLLQRTNRKEGARSGEEQKGSQLSKFSWRLSEKETIAVFFFFSCFEIIKPHKRAFSETGLLQSHKARLSEEWWGLTSEEARRGPQSRNTCSQYYLCFCISKLKQSSSASSRGLLQKKESSKIKAVQAQTRYQKGQIKRAFIKEEITEVTGMLEISNECFECSPSTLHFGALTFLWRVGENSRSKHYYQGKTSAIFSLPVNLIDSWLFWPWKKSWISKSYPVLCTTYGSSVSTMRKIELTKPPSFCIHIPFLSLTPLFFTLSLYYKIANSQCCHAPSNHLGVHNTLTPAAHHIYHLSFLLKLALLSGRALLSTVLGLQSMTRYHQLCPTHGQISPKGGTDILPHSSTAHCACFGAAQVCLFL